MTHEFFSRMRKELVLTEHTLYETILAISERINRKVQILQLHWQATTISNRVNNLYQDLGAHVCLALSAHTALDERPPGVDSVAFSRKLSVASETAIQLKETVRKVDNLIRELKLETIQEDLLKVQQDLAIRSAALERVVVARGAPADGHTLASLHLPSATRIVAVLRGPFLVPPADESFIFRADDVIIVVGLQDDLSRLLPLFTARRSLKTA